MARQSPIQKAVRLAEQASSLFDKVTVKLYESTALLDNEIDKAHGAIADLEKTIEQHASAIEHAVGEKLRNSRLVEKLEEFVR